MERKYLVSTYNANGVRAKEGLVFDSGSGSYLIDEGGRRYLDFSAGIAVNALGHSDADWIAAVTAQLAKATAVESAGFKKGMVAFESGFHGRTGFALSATHKPAIRQPFAPLIPDCSFLPYNDAEAAGKIADLNPATVIVEPHAGEGGVIAGTPAFLSAVEEQTKKAGAVLIADEVQCGLGRLGRLFAHEAYGMQPDIMTLAKPLAGGLPIGAVLVKEHIAQAIEPGDHGTTFGGNPLVCAAALHVLRRIDTPEFMSQVKAVGRAIKARADAIQRRFPQVITAVRAPQTGGPFVGMQMSVSPAALVKQCVDDGLLVITAGGTTLRLCPPLTMTVEEAESGMNTLERAMDAVFGTQGQ